MYIPEASSRVIETEPTTSTQWKGMGPTQLVLVCVKHKQSEKKFKDFFTIGNWYKPNSSVYNPNIPG